MKNLLIVALGGLLAVALAACSGNFIDLAPLDEASVANSFNTPDDANLAVLGVYDALQGNGYPEQTAYMAEMVSDNTTVQPFQIGASTSVDIREIERFQFTDQNQVIAGRWSGLYRGIARANLLLSKIEGIPFANESQKKQYVGEARFLRALFYFDLVRFFGGVAISLQQLNSAEEALSLKQATPQEVFDAVVADLQAASDVLPVSYPAASVGRATKGAAKALLAKVYLTNGKANLALPLLRELTTAPYTYRLMPTYAQAFDTDNTAESVFEIQYTSALNGEGNPYPNFNLPADGSAGRDIFGAGYLGGGAIGSNLPTREMWSSYHPGDPRRTYSLAKYYSKLESDTLFYITKYRGAPTSPNTSENNIPLLRYADVLLMLAEAINETSNGPTAEAFSLVDQIIRRASPALPLVNRSLNYEGFKDRLLEERRIEFAFENQRWFDLKRFGKAVPVLAGKGLPIQARHLVYPIPRKEIEINPNITQNPGY